MSNYFQVNWVNGMKITSGHFIDQENHFVQRIQRSIQGVVGDLSYGLLPPGEKEGNLPQFSISFSDNKIKLLNDLTVLTPEGHLILLPANLELALVKSNAEAAYYYLVISVKPFERIPYGLINEQESPLRFPDTIPEYQFHLVPANSTNVHTIGNSVVALGKFSGTSLEEDTSYIPPCCSVQSHPLLLDSCNKLQATFNDLEKKVLELLRKPNITNRPMLVNLLTFFNENKTALDWYLPYLPPVFLMEIISKAARVIYYSSEVQNIPFKDDLKSLLQGMMNFKYDHLEIGKAVVNARLFIDNYSKYLPKDDNIFGV